MNDILHLKIKAARRRANLTQQQLADALGVSRPAVSLWESKATDVRNEPTRTNLKKLAIATNVTLPWLIDDDDRTSLTEESMTKLINLSSLEAELLAVKESLKELKIKRRTHSNIAAELKSQIKFLELSVKNCEKVLHEWVNEPTLPVSKEEDDAS